MCCTEYEVRAIVGEKGTGKDLRYKVLWEGYSDKDFSWEPTSNLETCSVFIEHMTAQVELKEQEEREREREMQDQLFHQEAGMGHDEEVHIESDEDEEFAAASLLDIFQGNAGRKRKEPFVAPVAAPTPAAPDLPEAAPGPPVPDPPVAAPDPPKAAPEALVSKGYMFRSDGMSSTNLRLHPKDTSFFDSFIKNDIEVTVLEQALDEESGTLYYKVATEGRKPKTGWVKAANIKASALAGSRAKRGRAIV